MKKVILVIAIAVFGFFGTADAQQKIGHLNSADILQAMPEFKTMQTELQAYKDQMTKVLQGMYEDYGKKQEDLQKMTKETPDAIVETKIKELQDLQQRISDFENKINDDLATKQQEKLKPINDKYLKAVKEVATTNGYSYIIDIVSGAVAYYPEATNDVTSLVMKQMGITPAPKTNTGTNPTAPK